MKQHFVFPELVAHNRSSPSPLVSSPPKDTIPDWRARQTRPRRRTEHLLRVRFGLGFDEISADDLLLVDDDLNVLEGELGFQMPFQSLHLWIITRRRRWTPWCIHTRHTFQHYP